MLEDDRVGNTISKYVNYVCMNLKRRNKMQIQEMKSVNRPKSEKIEESKKA